ncbi:MAG: PepSY domain-containing protein [Rhodobacteraceae bacterium]|nr:PepSY domain-containing protein [Paracoccaceae bacterium]
MWRSLHAWIGLIFAIPVLVIAITGTILALKPMVVSFEPAVQDLNGVTLGAALALAFDTNPDLEIDRIKISDHNVVLVKGRVGSQRFERPLNVETGAFIAATQNHPIFDFTRSLHREFLLGKIGRKLSLISAIAMTLMTISGLFIVVRRLGGWRGILAKMQGNGVGKWHAIFGRALLPLLFITAITGAYTGMVTLGAVPSGADKRPYYPETPQELPMVAPYDLENLRSQPLSTLHQVLFPIPQDWFDVYALKTDSGYVFIDQYTGVILSQEPYSRWQVILDWMVFLHTGESAPIWALIMGIASMGIPLFVITGLTISVRRWGRKLKHNVPAAGAEIVILVGSENGSTFGFARHLHEKLTAAGKTVHLEAMNKVRAYPNATHLIVMVATYGDGEAPQNASAFLKNLSGLPASFAVLAFGDRSFPNFCSFGQQVNTALMKTADPLLPIGIIDRKSAHAFGHWGNDLAAALGLDFVLDYTPPSPSTTRLKLVEKIDFGQDLTARSVILKFHAAKGRLPKHQAGDLIGIHPVKGAPARLYSLASSASDGCVEICVSHHHGGLCSTLLNNMSLGHELEAYFQKNPGFALPRKDQPVVMIGAGTGIAPFAGMIRNNKQHQINLFWGNRHPASDFYYKNDIETWLADGRLHGFYPAFSRVENGIYVQERLKAEHDMLARFLDQNAVIMVCGGQNMASAVRIEIDALAKKTGTSLAELRKHNRYLEDVY